MYANARKYGLTGTDAMVFEALVYLCKNSGEWKGSYIELARFSCCGDRLTAMRSVKRLADSGIIVQNEQGIVQIERENVQNDTKSKEERTKEERKNNINKRMEESHTRPSTDPLPPLFKEFFDSYTSVSENKWKRSTLPALHVFEKMPRDWQVLAAQRAKDHPPDRDPYWYLKDEDFLRVGYGKKEAPAQPHWLTGEEQDECLKAGIILVVCRIPQTNRYGTVTKEDAEKFGLTILRQM